MLARRRVNIKNFQWFEPNEIQLCRMELWWQTLVVVQNLSVKPLSVEVSSNFSTFSIELDDLMQSRNHNVRFNSFGRSFQHNRWTVRKILFWQIQSMYLRSCQFAVGIWFQRFKSFHLYFFMHCARMMSSTAFDGIYYETWGLFSYRELMRWSKVITFVVCHTFLYCLFLRFSLGYE